MSVTLPGKITSLVRKFSSSAGSPPSEGDEGTNGHAGREEKTDERSNSGELRILLIEDSKLIKERLISMLTEEGVMRVTASAATEAEAREQIDAAEYDVLLVDVELREGSGIGAIRHARRCYPQGRQPLIVVLTNYPLPAVRSRCIDAGADHFLDKMHQFQDVKALISDARHLPRD
ncbi:MAG: response regulator [Gammaproteobacteria bacterium]